MADRSGDPGLSRRRFLQSGALAVGAAAVGPFGGLLACDPGGASPIESPYGPLRPVPDLATGLPLLRLPPDFQYRSMGWLGDPLDDGTPTPGKHDGMGVVAELPNRTRDLVLVRNHELAFGPLIGGGVGVPVYDPVVLSPELAAVIAGLLGLDVPAESVAGGTTRLTVRRGRLVSAVPALAGTAANCAGGPTPWQSWLTCEETMVDGTALGALRHGFVFEVPAVGVASARPIEDMGFFPHEACAVDPRTSIVYQTEDNGPESGFYRFLPNDTSQRVGALEGGGMLEMLAVRGEPEADLRSPEPGQRFDVEWVPIPEPGANPDSAATLLFEGPSGPLQKGRERGAAVFRRLEGCWLGRDVVYFVDTSGGAAGEGVVWCYEPAAADPAGGGTLTALFVSSGPLAGNNADNLTVSPRGGLLFCEEGGDPNRLMGLTDDGRSYVLAENHLVIESPVPGKPDFPPGDYRGIEWAGATFDPTGRILFVNIQTPGVTFAISGPWWRGPL